MAALVGRQRPSRNAPPPRGHRLVRLGCHHRRRAAGQAIGRRRPAASPPTRLAAFSWPRWAAIDSRVIATWLSRATPCPIRYSRPRRYWPPRCRPAPPRTLGRRDAGLTVQLRIAALQQARGMAALAPLRRLRQRPGRLHPRGEDGPALTGNTLHVALPLHVLAQAPPGQVGVALAAGAEPVLVGSTRRARAGA